MQIMQTVVKVGLLDIKCRDQIERLMRTANLSLLLPSFFRVASANPYGILYGQENGSFTPDGDGSVLGLGEWTAGKIFVLTCVIDQVGPVPAMLGSPTFQM